MKPQESPQPLIGRRNLLQALIAAPTTALFANYAFGEEETSAVSHELALAAATMGLISTNVASVMPETTEGPYYVDPKLVRSDITEDRKGILLRLKVQVVTADCQPVKSARVDLWHCDATGNYSGFEMQAEEGAEKKTFLRGTQMTDEFGVVTFETIYPGWYRGRTTHLHYKVFLDEKTVLTSQIFFPDALSEYIYLKHPVYHRDETRDTLNSLDGIATQAGEGSYCSIREQKDRYIAALVVGIDPKAEWKEGGQGMGGSRPPGGGDSSRPPGPPPNGTDGKRPPGPPPGGSGGPGGTGGPTGRRDENTKIFPGS
ncbi:intradiol ring-cleavage dioxygenase [Luteolibacter pohnpeiensis]|uniref:Intradiol ring-cleavage dioxygenase n=1 Tax=Luteolibacter pohnpeiensis TaxID=454153 RepID=A0A934S309_9BACT|nr:intradiol ring-cleavage dioxygenase [Luteolibacter pohnpeiensis]MBK1881402.1 intradiol ring-cleavage dioxygenase [Luteolibacter pohnpeiensis]